MYVMIQNGKLHMSKHKIQVSYRIFHKEESEREKSYICPPFFFKKLLANAKLKLKFTTDVTD